MKGDFSRSTFDPRKHYRGVRMQQGRVQLDADWNESLDVLLHRIETEAIDVIGECGVPEHHAAFGAVIDPDNLPAEDQVAGKEWLAKIDKNDFVLTSGRAYVDGILVEMDKVVPFSKQPYGTPDMTKLPEDGVYALYLDVWERLITALDDPSIRETALGGPDTAVRGQVIWQAKLEAAGKGHGENISCASIEDPWPGPSTGRLSARTTPSPNPKDPCTVAPGAGYKRLENQFYRVEIHNTGKGKTTFKWSRENGSVVVRINQLNVDSAPDKIKVDSLGRDDVLGFHELDFVEVIDEAHELGFAPGLMAKILKIDPDDNVLTLDQNVTGFDESTAKLRRWESGELEVTVPAQNDGYIELEDGVEIKFHLKDGKNTFHTGDYWQIPARTVPGKFGNIEWPVDASQDPISLLPFGIQHHYCKLAIITVSNGVIVDIKDCRKKFKPLTEIQGGKCCCSVTVGPYGDYADLQSAIDARPNDAEVWHVCLEPGKHYLQQPVEVAGAVGLAITGCELQTVLVAPDGAPAMVFGGGGQIRVEGFILNAGCPEGALIFNKAKGVRVARITSGGTKSYQREDVNKRMMMDNTGMVRASSPVIVAIACTDVEIADNNLIGMPAVKAQAKALNIHHNRIQKMGGVQILPGSVNVTITDNLIGSIKNGPGIQLGGLSEEDGKVIFEKADVEYYKMDAGAVKAYQVKNDAIPSYAVVSDAQVDAQVTENAMPEGNNVYTTHMQMEMNVEGSYHEMPSRGLSGSTLAISGVRITGNMIIGTNGSGISTKKAVNDKHDLGDIEDLTISGNHISGCGKDADLDVLGAFQVGGGIVLTGAFGADISNNFITENGGGKPACGIYLLDSSDIDISGNTIAENGTSETDSNSTLFQAGIGGHFVFGNLLGDFVDGIEDARYGYPALRIHGNEVVCPSGPALSVIAMGGVMAEDNTFASREIRKQGGPLDQLERGSCVNILNLGIPAWYGDLITILLAMQAGKMDIHVEGDDLEKLEELIALLPDGRVLFNNNQVNFRTTVMEEIDADRTATLAELLAMATLSTYIHTLDDAGIQNNQFQASVPNYAFGMFEQIKGMEAGATHEMPPSVLAYLLKFIHVVSIGMTVRATGNAISENLGAGLLSYGSSAVSLNMTSLNQMTHALFTLSGTPKNYFDNNQSLLY